MSSKAIMLCKPAVASPAGFCGPPSAFGPQKQNVVAAPKLQASGMGKLDLSRLHPHVMSSGRRMRHLQPVQAADAGAAAAKLAANSSAGTKLAAETKEMATRLAVAGDKVMVAEDNFMDSISRWIWHRIQPVNNKCGGACDWLSFLPDPIHKRLHNCEPTAVVVVREVLLLLLSYSIFVNAGRLCRQANWAWGTFVRKDDHVTEEEFRESGFDALVAPLKFFTLLITVTRHIREGLPKLRIPVDPHVIGRIREVSFVFAATWFLLGWKRRVFHTWRQHASKADKPRLVFAERTSSLALFFLGFFTAAETLGIPLRAITTFGGVTGIAIGLASKEVVTNFFGGAVLWLTRPFVPGDAIKADKFSGIVQDIGYFQTKLLGFDKSHITVPNQVFTNMVITNVSRASHRNLDLSFELRQQDILKVDAITRRITEMVGAHSAVDTSAQRHVCYIKALKDSSIVVIISAAVKSMSGADFGMLQQEIYVKAAQIIVEEGASIGSNCPFPPTELQLSGREASNGASTYSEEPVSAST